MTTLLLALGVSAPVFAATCAFCHAEYTGTTHINDVSHAAQEDYIYPTEEIEGLATETQHRGICTKCMLKHSDTCEAIRGPWEDHKFETVGNGAERKKVCSVCGYTVAIPCLHPTTAWTSDNLEECSLKCADCGFALKTEKHDVVAVAKENDGLTAVLLLNCFINLKEEGKNAKLYKSFRIYDGSIAYGYEYCAC